MSHTIAAADDIVFATEDDITHEMLEELLEPYIKAWLHKEPLNDLFENAASRYSHEINKWITSDLLWEAFDEEFDIKYDDDSNVGIPIELVDDVMYYADAIVIDDDYVYVISE